MGRATGFIEYSRALPVQRAPVDRVQDWSEFRGPLDEVKLGQQAARCMDCGVPFCHTGEIIGGAVSGCPLNNVIPEWNHLVYSGNWRAAFASLEQTNNFPEFTGRVCPAPCEASCVLGINDEAVAIKSIECAIVDRAFEQGWIVPRPPKIRTGKRIGVIGSGPAGLACAAELNKKGHSVVVFEKSDRIGGLLMYGIPNMKLDKTVVQRRVDLLAQEGVEFVGNTEIGRDYESGQLVADFDAIVLCNGASRPRDLKIEGRHLKGINFAMEFLEANTKQLLNGLNAAPEEISARGNDVIVIGGGDTGTDCVGTALRQGCKSLVQFEILPQPGDSRAGNNPWPQWPRIHRLDYGHEEAKAVFGTDPRLFSVRTESFTGDRSGRVAGVTTIDMQGGLSGGSLRTWPAQLVLIAMGFLGANPEGPINDLGLKMTARGNLEVDEHKMTNLPGVFAAGDVERGQSLVVWAIADGRRAAFSVDRCLRSQS